MRRSDKNKSRKFYLCDGCSSHESEGAHDGDQWFCKACWSEWFEENGDEVGAATIYQPPPPKEAEPDFAKCVACKEEKLKSHFSSKYFKARPNCVCTSCISKKAEFITGSRVDTKFGLGIVDDPPFSGKLKLHVNIKLPWGKLLAPFFEIEMEKCSKETKEFQVRCSGCYQMLSSRDFAKPNKMVPVCMECMETIGKPVMTCVTCCQRRISFSRQPYPKFYDRILGDPDWMNEQFSERICLLCADPNVTLLQAVTSKAVIDERYSRKLYYLSSKFPKQVSNFNVDKKPATRSAWRRYQHSSDGSKLTMKQVKYGLESLKRAHETTCILEEQFREYKHEMDRFERRAIQGRIGKQKASFLSGKRAMKDLLVRASDDREGWKYIATVSVHGHPSLAGISHKSKKHACKLLYEQLKPHIQKLKVMENADYCELCNTYCTTKDALTKHLRGSEHLKAVNDILATCNYYEMFDEVSIPEYRIKGRITQIDEANGKYKIKNGQMNHGWFREEDLDIIRLRIPSLAEFKGENKLKIDIIYGPADFDVYSRLNLEWAQKWFRKAFGAHVRDVRVLGAQWEVQSTCLQFGWPFYTINLVLQFAGYWGFEIYFEETGSLWWNRGTSLVSKQGTFV